MQIRQQWLRSTLWIVFSLVVLFSGVRLYYFLTDDFRISNITYDMPYHAEWKTAPLAPTEQERLDAILNQKFYYLGKGAQSYAFSSEDKKYVLKFFKFKHLKPSLFIRSLPDIAPFTQIKQHESSEKERKLNNIFTGYKLAYDVEKEGSSLLYVQLNPSHIKKNLSVINKLGLEHTIDLGSVVYVVQEKGEPLSTIFSELLDQGNLALVKERMGQLLDLYVSGYQKGIYDKDHGVMHNRGFIGNKPFLLDVGKLKKDERTHQPDFVQKDLTTVALRMESWFRRKYPDQAPELNQDLEQKISKIFGKPFKFSA